MFGLSMPILMHSNVHIIANTKVTAYSGSANLLLTACTFVMQGHRCHLYQVLQPKLRDKVVKMGCMLVCCVRILKGKENRKK